MDDVLATKVQLSLNGSRHQMLDKVLLLAKYAHLLYAAGRVFGAKITRSAISLGTTTGRERPMKRGVASPSPARLDTGQFGAAMTSFPCMHAATPRRSGSVLSG